MQEQPVDLTLLSAYLDGEVTPEERALVEAQLRLSPAWREELESLRWTVSLLRELPEAPLPRSFELPVPAETARATTRLAARPSVWGLDLGWLYGFLRGSAVVAVALLLAVAGLDVWQTQSDLNGIMAERQLSERAPETALSSPASAPAQRFAQPPQAEAPKAGGPAAPTAARPAATDAPAAKALQNPAVQPTFPAAAPPRPGSGGGGGGGEGGAGGLGGGAGAGAATSGTQDGVTIVGTPAPAAGGGVQSSTTPDTQSALAPKAQPQAGAVPPPSEAVPQPLAASPQDTATPTPPSTWWRWLEIGLAGLTVALVLGAWAVRRRLKTDV